MKVNENIMNINEYVPMLVVIVMAFAVCVLVIVVMASKRKQANIQMNFLQSFTEQFKPALGLEKNLDFILLKTQELIEAQNYSFYIYNPSNQRFTLKAVRQLISDTKIAPSYSGLLPYEKEKFEPPLSLAMESLTEKTTILKHGEVPLLTIPIQGGKGLIRIGPVAKVSAKTIKNFEIISRLLEAPVNNLIEEEDHRRNYEVMETSAKAVKYINQLFIHEVEYIKLITQTSMKSTNPSSCLIMESSAAFQRIVYSYGVNNQIVQHANNNRDFLVKLKAIIDDKPLVMFQNTSNEYAELNNLLATTTGGYFVLCQFTLVGKQYVLLFSFEKDSKNIESIRSQSIKMLWSQIQQFVQLKHHSKQASIAYTDFLKNIADLIDQMSPFTTGASKLTANYSMAIAKEMGLSEYQIQSIGLAAYLSNIGIIGLSDGLLNKEGVYSDKEYEQMKLHSEVGAAIIEHTIANEDVALYVRHHHERMDGNGYPSRLFGEHIPIGARIISVVQTFLAKINGRSYRDPLPFDDALKLIRDSAGSQLDSKVVAVFLQWYNTRRHVHRGKHTALGNCWDLCCVPSSICSQCPAYGNTTKNCWEFERNNCLAHGKTCETCFVYTEAMSRSGQLKASAM